MNKKEFKNIEIPFELFKKIEGRPKKTGFESASDYIIFVLKEVVSDHEEKSKSFSQEDEEKVRKRLKDLGYM